MSVVTPHLTLSDAGRGDVVEIEGREYRLMIECRDGWLCRPDRTGEHEFISNLAPISRITFEMPRRNPKARKAKGRGDINDPMQNSLAWRGTVR
jgi:hypothetical protein